MQKAKVRLEKELNMIELLKSRRFFYEVMKVLLTKDQHMALWSKSRYIVIDPSDNEEENDIGGDKSERQATVGGEEDGKNSL